MRAIRYGYQPSSFGRIVVLDHRELTAELFQHDLFEECLLAAEV